MARRGGWRRLGSKGRFRYEDSRWKRITDPAKLARIEALAVPPAWRDVRISPRSNAKVQATGYDNAGRLQYLYHEDFRAAQEQEKFDRLVLFGERLAQLREAMSAHMEHDPLDRERVSAIALRLIGLGWLRVGSERYARESRTYGVTTLFKRHVDVRGERIRLRFPTKGGAQVQTTVVDEELADAVRGLLRVPGGRLFRYRWNGDLYNLTGKRLNDYVEIYLGDEFTAKDFRTWGGTVLAAIAFAEREPPESEADGKRQVAAVMRQVAKRLGNTPAVCRASYVSPAVIEQYLDGRTIDDFPQPHLRVVRARSTDLSPEEEAVLSLLRSWRIRRARAAA